MSFESVLLVHAQSYTRLFFISDDCVSFYITRDSDFHLLSVHTHYELFIVYG